MAKEAGLVLHGYWRSSTSFRVRAALQLKGVAFAQETYDLPKGAQRAPGYTARNPQGLVPALELAGGDTLMQSLAILEWIDDAFAQPPLLPPDKLGRARVRALAHTVALDIHPINNLRVLNYLRTRFDSDEEAIGNWFRHWVDLSFTALETRLAREPQTGRFCHGNCVTIADICLVAQSVNNRRFAVDETVFPTIWRIVSACLEMKEFQAALPEKQPDAF